jgi:hypothetical protein
MIALRRLTVSLTAAAALAGGIGCASTAHATVADDWAGVNAQFLFTQMPRSAWDTHVDEMRSAGVKVVRLDASWNTVEPVAPSGGVHAYRWSFYDAVVAELAARGIRWYPIVDYSAPWAGEDPGQWRTPPSSDAEFAGYAAALARRYGPGGTFWAAHPELPALPVRQWEIWNEENGAYFWPSAPDAAAYASLYAAAHEALHAVDPGARVVVGGLLARGSGQFVSDMLAARPELRDEIDAVGLHAYGASVDASIATMVDLRNWLGALGMRDTPIEVTEVGWATQGLSWAVPDSVRASDLAQLLPRAAALRGVTRLLVHTWMTRELTPSNGEDWFGLVHPDGTPSASGTAFAQALGALVPSDAGASIPTPTTTVTPPPAAAAPATTTASAPAAADPVPALTVKPVALVRRTATAAKATKKRPTLAQRRATLRRCLATAARRHTRKSRARARSACTRAYRRVV